MISNATNMISRSLIAIVICLLLVQCCHDSPTAPVDEPFINQDVVFFSRRAGTRNIFAMNSDGSDARQVTHYTEGDFYPAAVSPDGTKLLFYRMDESTLGEAIYLMEFGGPEPSVPIAYGRAGNFTQDGRQFAYAQHSWTLGHDLVFVFDFRDTSSRQVTPDSVHCWDPSISPDGSHIAYSVWRSPPFSNQILYISDLFGRNETALVPTGGYRYCTNARFAPDGNSVYFTGQTDRTTGICSIIPGAQNAVWITGQIPNPDGAPCPNTKGDVVFFHRGSDQLSHILSIHVDGTQSSILTDGNTSDRNPVVGFVKRF